MLRRIKDAFWVLIGNRGGGKPETKQVRGQEQRGTVGGLNEPRSVSEDVFVALMMDQYDVIKSQLMSGDKHPEGDDNCPHCRMSVAVKGSSRYESVHQTLMSNLLEESPLVSLDPLPISQMIFDTFNLGAILSRAATINAIEKGELEVWIQKAQIGK